MIVIGFFGFFTGVVVGFLICVVMTVDMLKRRGLFKDGDVIDLRPGEIQ